MAVLMPWTRLALLCLLTGIHCELFSSIALLHKLMKQGDDHMVAARHLAERHPRDGSTVLKLLSEVSLIYKDQPASVEHPITTLKILKTFHAAANFTDARFHEELAARGALWPSVDDVTGAYHAIARLQKTYELPYDDVIGGDLAGIRSAFGLDDEDVVGVAEQAANIGYNATATRWLERGRGGAALASGGRRRLIRRLAGARDEPADAGARDPGSEAGIGVGAGRLEDKSGRYPEYERLCRMALTSGHGSRRPLFCSYRSGYVPYVRYRQEFFSLDPLIAVFYDVVTRVESLLIKYVAPHVMESGGIAIKGEFRDVSSFDNRVGQVGWLYDEWHPIIARVSRRIADVTALSTAAYSRGTHAEPLQVCNYGVGGHFRPHQDAFADGVTNVPEMASDSGNRDATFMIYLSDVRAGGATVFPELGVYVRPVSRAAAFWMNTRRSGRRDRRSVHAGCPVLVGDKWIANKWIWSVGQTFRRRCGLTENATDVDVEAWRA